MPKLHVHLKKIAARPSWPEYVNWCSTNLRRESLQSSCGIFQCTREACTYSRTEAVLFYGRGPI